MTLKLLFDSLGCMYIIRKLQGESFKLQSLDEQRFENPEIFYLKFGEYIDSILIEYKFEKIDKNDRVLVKMDEGGKYRYSLAHNLKEVLTSMKLSYLDFKLGLPKDDYEAQDDKIEMKRVFEQFFKFKVRHKFYCWKYFRGFINIFCTPIYRNLKPYELFNIEMNQHTHNFINLIRKNDRLQQVLNERKLYLEILLQTLEVKKFDAYQSDVSFTIRYHDRNTKEYADVKVTTQNKFNEIFLAGKKSDDPIYDIFYYMTISVSQIKELTPE